MPTKPKPPFASDKRAGRISVPRTLRLFLSSTFRDFGEERDLLVKRVFPALRARLRDRFVELVDVDLRWGITAKEAERGEVLPICLAEIDRARPYFIGMLGDRYGWIPPAGGYAADLLERQPWLKKHQGGKSVTELEILHGVLNNRSMRSRAFFYFRSPAYARAKGGDYLPSAEDRTRQTELKSHISERGLPVTTYANPEALAKRIERDLWQLLDTDFPASEVPDAYERERLRHEAYAAPRRQLYLGGERYQAALTKLLEADEARIVIEGVSGGGKSALLANFFDAYRKRHRRHLVHEHYLGASTDAADPHALVRRLIEFVQRVTSSTEEIPSDPQKLMDSVPKWLDIASAWARKRRTRFIIVLDSLNSLTDQHELQWWPAFLPKGVTMLVSCLPGPVYDALKRKAEALTGQEKPPKWNTVTVRPLTKAQSATLLNTYLARFNKELPAPMVRQVQAHPLATNPLFLRTLAEELRLFGVHEELQKQLDHYLSSQTIDDLFERVLERVEKDCGKKQVKAAMTSIWASRAGLTEKEILGIANLKPAQWATIRHAFNSELEEMRGKMTFAHSYIREAVSDRYLPSHLGRLSAHRALARWFSAQSPDARRAEEEPWQLNKIGASARLRKCLLDPVIFLALWELNPTELLSYWRDHWEGRNLATDYNKVHPEWIAWRSQHDPRRRIWPRLITALADAVWEAGIYGKFGAALQMYARDLTAARSGARSLAAARRDLHCAHYLRQMEDDASIDYAKRAVRSLESMNEPLELLEGYLTMAAVLDANGEGWKAQGYLDLASEQLDRLPQTASKTMARLSYLVAWFFYGWADRRSGMPVSAAPSMTIPVFEALVIELESSLGREHRRTLGAVDILVGCLLEAEHFAQASNLAMSLYLRCVRSFGDNHVQTAYAAGKFGKAKLQLDDLDSAEWGLSIGRKILITSFPPGHQNRIFFHDSLAVCLEKMGKMVQAEAVREELEQGLIGRYFNDPPLGNSRDSIGYL
jgi:hypothetical protein